MISKPPILIIPKRCSTPRMSPGSFFKKLTALAKKLNPILPPRRHIMHDPEKRSLQSLAYDPYWEGNVRYREYWFALQVFCDPKGDKKGRLQVSIITNPKKRSTNTQLVTLTNTNGDPSLGFFVQPSLVRSSGLLKVPIRTLGHYPVMLKTMAHSKRPTIWIGALGPDLIPRVLEVAIAKHESISRTRRKRIGKRPSV